MSFRSLSCAAPVLLAACGDAEVPAMRPEGDPAMIAALHDPLMTDPDLVAQNRASNAALLPDNDGSIPAQDASPMALAAARSEALALVGGPGRMKAASQAGEAADGTPQGPALTAVARAAAMPGVSRACLEAATYTAAWAAKMPETFPVYPRAAVHDAAGTDAGRCALRTVDFTTPVPPDEVIDFYYTRASAAGFTVGRRPAELETTLRGSNGERSFVVSVRRRDDGLTSVELVTSGR